MHTEIENEMATTISASTTHLNKVTNEGLHDMKKKTINGDGKPLMSSAHGQDLNVSNNSDSLESREYDGSSYKEFAFPANPSISDYICFVPYAISHCLKNMSEAFGWKFVVIIIVVYGFQVRILW